MNAAAATNAPPLSGIRVLELADAGPVPVAAMMLHDLGADVVRIERPGIDRSGPEWVTLRGRPSIAIDLKRPQDVELLKRMIGRADVLMEGFRPGVMERLGLGPDVAAALNPRLVYCRATGWGQTGPLAKVPGHDLNYIAITGILGALGRRGEPPPVPLNLLGDFAGGTMFLLVGLLAALIEARASGRGQVIDSAMSEGASALASFLHYMRAAGRWSAERGENLLDGGAPFYNVYACADGRHLAVGAIEAGFYAELRRLCDLTDPAFDSQHDRARWPELRARMAALFLTRTRDQWCALLEGTDACVSPVLEWDEAPLHPHNSARRAFDCIDAITRPAAAPRFSRSTLRDRAGAPAQFERGDLLAAWGVEAQHADP